MGPTVISLSLHTDCLIGTSFNADAAVNAGFGIDLCLAIDHSDGLAWALFHTGFATSTLCLIYFCRHLHNPFQKQHSTDFTAKHAEAAEKK
jgi:hypothetical protein